MIRSLFLSALFLVLILIFSGQNTWGQIPETINYQGVLTDASGTVVPDGNFQLTFRLYDADTGGNLLWTEVHNSVAVSNGIFNVILGSIVPFNLPFDRQYWLGATLGSDPELTPRIPLASSPYSLNSPGGGVGDGHSLNAADGTPMDAVFVDNNGNVGIGTTSPSTLLHISKNSSTANTITVENTANFAGSDAVLSLLSGPGGADIEIRAQRSPNVGIIDIPGLALLLQPSGGIVGIGTTLPTVKLDVAGFVKATAFFGNGSALTGVSGTDNTKVAKAGDTMNGTLTFNSVLNDITTGTNEDLALIPNGSGNVGIGTTSPSTLLHISKNSSKANTITVENTANFPGSDAALSLLTLLGADIEIRAQQVNGIIDIPGLQPLGIQTSGGRVGIGTTNPSAKFEVHGDGDEVIELESTNATAGRRWGFQVVGSSTINGGRLRIIDRTATDAERLTISTSGNVGIGNNNPQSALHISGYTQLDLTNGSPPISDCDEASERGRMKVDNAAAVLWICVDTGWIAK